MHCVSSGVEGTKEGLGFYVAFNSLGFYCDEIETRTRGEIHFSL